jgi:hypothetical protein
MGPNQKKLISHRAAQLMVPPGGGLSEGVKAIIEYDKPGGLIDCTRRAQTWVGHAIAALKQAKGGEHLTDEQICGDILSRLPKTPREKLEEKLRQMKESQGHEA